MNLLRVLDSIYEYATGTRLALGIVILVGFAVGSFAFLAPLVVVALAISALGLDQEPNKWLGTILILACFVGAIVATALSLRWVYRRSRPLLAHAVRENEPAVALGPPSPIVASRPAAPSMSRSQLQAIDGRLAPAPGNDPPAVNAPAAPISGGEPPTHP